jgi:hypothetical protein
MALTYKEKMVITERLLNRMKLSLSGKKTFLLPIDGVISNEDPSDTSLVGVLAPRPDPNFRREQAPSAMGMVLMIEPNIKGEVSVNLNGRFDVTHRYIPSLRTMLDHVQVGPEGEKSRQKIPETYKRFTVCFNAIEIALNVNQLNRWIEIDLNSVMRPLQESWKLDPRIFRLGKVNEQGWVSQIVPWIQDQCESDEQLVELIAKTLFISEDILEHAIVIRARLRSPPIKFEDKGRFLLEIYLQNNTETLTGRSYCLNKPCLLDVDFEANIHAGQQVDVPHRLQPEDYRYQPEDGVAGYGVTCAVNKVTSTIFRTNSMPFFAQARVDAPSPIDVAMPLAASFKLLSEKTIDVLEGFVRALNNYNATWDAVESKLKNSGQVSELKEVQSDRAVYELEIVAIIDGVELLRKHEKLRRCFSLMNEVMGMAISLQGKNFDGWHLFQLGFILTQVRSVYERHCLEHESLNVSNTADVLWFSTGGGKTEAYLGIIAFSMLYGRVKGRLYGTTAWMRFPLRMLSAQQFQRLSYVVAQAEILRCREGIDGHPFTVGYFTGSGTPSNISRSENSGAAVWLPDLSTEQLNRFQFITDCPFCGKVGSIYVRSDPRRGRLLHSCKNIDCWSNSKSPFGMYGEGTKEEVGIYVSDEECYRYLPTVLVGTVDKLAVIAHNERFAGYFGAFKYFCPEHGFTPDSKCMHRRIRINIRGEYESVDCGNNSRTSKVRTIQMQQMLDPGFSFLIQDELHLLRESLGNFDAHYETLLQALQVGHGGQSAKVLAATATIKDFENHILHLYMKPGRRFPAQGAKRGESFYSRISWDGNSPLIRRWYVGILPLTFNRGGTERAAAEVASRYQDIIDDWLIGLANQDPIILDQIGFPLERSSELISYIGKYLNTDLIYANQKRQTTGIREHLENINSRDLKTRTHVLLDGQTPLDEILNAIHLVETKTANDTLRHIVATSVVSHGVDISELNFMVLDGWPRSTAEYIQSSARSGRVQPGIVMSILSSGKLFESGVFLNFGDYHFFLDKLVDSVPINRFAPNVLQRTLPGVFTAVVYNWAKFQTGWGEGLNRSASQLHKALNNPKSDTRKQLFDMLTKALDIPASLEQHFDIRVLHAFRKQVRDEIGRGLHRLQNLSAASFDKDLGAALESIYQFGPMRSFRDIENQVEITPHDSKSVQVLKVLGR